jgi:ParB family chromosome partitioning protein
MPGLVLISNEFSVPEGAPILPRRNYVEVVAQKAKGREESRPWNRTCNYTKTAIYADGMSKGSLAKVCADPSCKIHFEEQQQAEKQRIAWKAQRSAENLKAKQMTSFRHLLLSETLKRLKPQLGNEQLRLVARYILATLPHEQLLRLGKRHGLETTKDRNDWQVVEKARYLYKTTEATELARLLFEAMLVGSAANFHADKENDLLTDVATLYEVDRKALRAAVEKDARKKAERKKMKAQPKNTARKQKPPAER